MSRKDGKQVEEEPWAGRIPSDCEVWLRKENYGDSITFENPGERDACFMDFFMGNKNFSGFLYQLANGVYHVCSFYPAWTGGGSCFSASYPETTKAPLIGAVMQKSDGEV